MSELYIGLMSGTSLDGVDGVLVDLSDTDYSVVQHTYEPFSDALVNGLLALNTTGADELHRCALAANTLAGVYAKVVIDLLGKSGVASNRVVAIGVHGQTVRHRPEQSNDDADPAAATGAKTNAGGYTVQLNNPALLAELTGIDVVADFRSRDVAAGGQGAPLVPAFHQVAFGRADDAVAVLNIGGISNLTVLGPLSARVPDDVIGFDCGPGNALMDHWCQQHTGQTFDAAGHWAATGQVNHGLLKAMLDEPFFAKNPPKSTGRDLFNTRWLKAKLADFPAIKPVDVQATLAELTASSCASCVIRFGIMSKSLVVCGGGALNTFLMARLQANLPALQVVSSQARGLPPLQVEATAFAWLARKAIKRETGSLPKVTGARGARILGAIYPA